MAQLRHNWDRFEDHQARAVIVTFGVPRLAQAWLEETRLPFELWLDPERAAYRAFGLEHSFVRSWGLRTIAAYAKLMLRGRRWRGIQGDSGQLGGDIVVDANGIVRFTYRSQDPTDRPSIDALLGIFRRLAA